MSALVASGARLRLAPGRDSLPIALSKRFLGMPACLAAQQRRPALRRRFVVTPRANELNHWADRSNYDSHDESSWEFAQFDRDTANTLLKVLTLKATQRLLLQLQELDMFKAQWFNNYCSANSPSTGNKFVLGLFRTPATVVRDAGTSTDHSIDPANLAHRIIQIRADMAQTLVKLPKYVEQKNTEVLRQHLTKSTYLSGSTGDSYKERRGYHRPRN